MVEVSVNRFILRRIKQTRKEMTPKLRGQKLEKLVKEASSTETTRQELLDARWTGRDLNPRPPPCEGGIPARLNYRPFRLNLTFVRRLL